MRWRLPFLHRSETISRPVEARIPEGQRVYAIGDVHGRLDLLIGLIDRIRGDNRRRGAADTHIVLLGDLIDRGPRSAHVIEYLRVHQRSFARFHCLCGNHEEVMLAALAPGARPEETGWLDFGGQETMQSYGADPHLFDFGGAELAAAMRALVPATHLDFITGFPDRLLIGDYLFVHAGIRPGIAIDRQKSEDLRWIRGDFLKDRRDHGVMIVHGHNISAEPDLQPNRIGIDTGAYRTGCLTALGLEGDDRWLLMEQGDA